VLVLGPPLGAGSVRAAAPPAASPAAPPVKASEVAAPAVADLVGRLKACKALTSCAPVRALLARGPAIWPALRVGLEAPDEMTRFWTLGVLSELPIPAAREAIEARLGDPKIRVRAAAAYALGALRDRAVSPALVRALQDNDLNVRFAAAVALGRVHDPATVGALVAACRDKDDDVRAYAALALGDTVGAMDAGAPGREAARAQARRALLERLDQDLFPKVRGFAAMALSKLRDPATLHPLLARLRAEDDPKALAAAVFALGALGDVAALNPLRALQAGLANDRREALRDDAELREYLRDAIQELTPKPAPPAAPATGSPAPGAPAAPPPASPPSR